MPTITYSQANSAFTQKAIILNNTHAICNRCDTDVVICRILVVWKSADGFAIFWILNSKTMVNLEPRFNCQYHLSSSVRNWQNIIQPFSETTKLIETTLWLKSKIATNAVRMFYWWSGASIVSKYMLFLEHLILQMFCALRRLNRHVEPHNHPHD